MQGKVTIKAAARWQVWKDEPLMRNEQFPEGSILAAYVHEHKKEQTVLYIHVDSCIMFHYLIPCKGETSEREDTTDVYLVLNLETWVLFYT